MSSTEVIMSCLRRTQGSVVPHEGGEERVLKPGEHAVVIAMCWRGRGRLYIVGECDECPHAQKGRLPERKAGQGGLRENKHLPTNQNRGILRQQNRTQYSLGIVVRRGGDYWEENKGEGNDDQRALVIQSWAGRHIQSHQET